ncbi:hypothetical protein G7Y79_00003g009760 [Physcia stellaris]|nr:hypothetical protein G7Y79_00003g009760 [Physcia stellaris]
MHIFVFNGVRPSHRFLGCAWTMANRSPKPWMRDVPSDHGPMLTPYGIDVLEASWITIILKSLQRAVEMKDQLPRHSSQCLAELAGRLPQANLSRWQTDVINEARAMRVAEVINDFHLIQRRMAQYEATPSPDEFHEEGYEILRQCRAEAQAVLATPFQNELLQVPRGPDEAEKRQLQRRFQAQKIYLRATAAMRWINTRNALLRGQNPQTGQMAQLQQIDRNLRAELAAITNERIMNEFREKDTEAEHYLTEDPSLTAIVNWIRNR